MVWILIFILSLILLVKSADWLVESSEKIGLAFKIPPFIIGVTIVAIGTSLPELASSIVATLKGTTEIVTANAIGSNIANILLILGLAAIAARTLVVKRSLIDLDSPLLGITTFLFIFIMWDKKVVFGEGVIFILGFLVYLLYTIFYKKEEEEELDGFEVLPSRLENKRKMTEKRKESQLNFKVYLLLILGILGLAIGSNYIINSMMKISEFFKISSSLIAITALAIGTSLPELIVSLKAAINKKYEIALGNIFGSNIFNILLVVGIPALIKPLVVSDITFNIGLPFLAVSTVLFIISGISKRIHIWEGMMYILLYSLFIIKLCGVF